MVASIDMSSRRSRASGVAREDGARARDALAHELYEVVADFAERPEQVGHWLADLEVAGVLAASEVEAWRTRVAERMGDDFAARAFGARAADVDALLADIRRDAEATRPASDADERARVKAASAALHPLATRLGLKLPQRVGEAAERKARDRDRQASETAAMGLRNTSVELDLMMDLFDPVAPPPRRYPAAWRLR